MEWIEFKRQLEVLKQCYPTTPEITGHLLRERVNGNSNIDAFDEIVDESDDLLHIILSFTWSYSTEGHDFWDGVFEWCLRNVNILTDSLLDALSRRILVKTSAYTPAVCECGHSKHNFMGGHATYCPIYNENGKET